MGVVLEIGVVRVDWLARICVVMVVCVARVASLFDLLFLVLAVVQVGLQGSSQFEQRASEFFAGAKMFGAGTCDCFVTFHLLPCLSSARGNAHNFWSYVVSHSGVL